MCDNIMMKVKFYNEINDCKMKRDKGWERYFSIEHPYHKIIKDRFSWIMPYVVGPKVLDVGCGPGLGCYLAAKKEDIIEVCGLDLQKDLLAEAKQNVKSKKVRFCVAFAEDLPFESKYFDCVMLTETLEHIYDVKEGLVEAHRVLKPNGRIIITVPKDKKISKIHIRVFDKDILTRLAEPYFDIEEMVDIGISIGCIGKNRRTM